MLLPALRNKPLRGASVGRTDGEQEAGGAAAAGTGNASAGHDRQPGARGQTRWATRRVRDVYVYLPPGYEDDGRRRYPVVLVLTGFTGIGENPWQRKGWGEALHQRMDRLVRTGKVQPMILVTPDCFTSLGGSQYVDSPAIGDYETFVVDEVVPYVDRAYRTLSGPAHHGVCGKSSGGYGALMLGMRHPKVFGAIASHSGDAYFDYCYAYDFVRCWDALRRAGGLEKFLRAFRKKKKIGSADIHRHQRHRPWPPPTPPTPSVPGTSTCPSTSSRARCART